MLIPPPKGSGFSQPYVFMENKNYSLHIDEEGNANFIFDESCREYLGTPKSVTTNTSMQIIPGNDKKTASLVKTTVIKEIYALKKREIQKSDIEFALSLIEEQRTMLTIDLLFAEEYLVPGIVSKIEVSKMQGRDFFKMAIDLEYDEFYQGELNSHKVKEKAAFVVDRSKLYVIYEQLASTIKLKDTIKLLQTLKEMFKEIMVPGSNVSEKEKFEVKKDHTKEKNKGKEQGDD